MKYNFKITPKAKKLNFSLKKVITPPTLNIDTLIDLPILDAELVSVVNTIYKAYSWERKELITKKELIDGVIYYERKNLAFNERIKPDTAEELKNAEEFIKKLVSENILKTYKEKIYYK